VGASEEWVPVTQIHHAGQDLSDRDERKRCLFAAAKRIQVPLLAYLFVRVSCRCTICPPTSLPLGGISSGSIVDERRVQCREGTQVGVVAVVELLPVVALERGVGDTRLILQPRAPHPGVERGSHEGILRAVDAADAKPECPQAAIPVGRR